MSMLGRIPETDDYKDMDRNDEFIVYPGVLILRFDAPIVFANAHTRKQKIIDKVREEKYVELVVLDMETSPMIDVTASDMLGELDDVLFKKGIAFRLANASGEVRDVLKAMYSQELVGHIHASTTVNHVVKGWLEIDHSNQLEEEIL
jgi:MFS superfamily sulfate permease-like transporter